jgi:hypothetical protein
VQIGFSKEGILNGIIVNVFGNAGMLGNDHDQPAIFQHIDNCKSAMLLNCDYIMVAGIQHTMSRIGRSTPSSARPTLPQTQLAGLQV